MLSRALEKQNKAVDACVWKRIGVVTLRGCRSFVLVGRFRAGPSGGAAAFRKAFRQERKTGYGPFQQEQVL